MRNKIKLIIADDHPVLLKGLINVICTEPSIEILSSAMDGEDALNKIVNLNPDVALLDIKMPYLTGFDIVEKLRELKSSTKVIFLTMHKEEDVFNLALDAGVMGYLLKESATEDIIECIKAVAENKHYISPVISDYLINRISRASNKKNKLDKLTATEKNILKLISEKKSSKEIADTLFISLRTVENHRTNICTKLEIHGSNSLQIFAVENKHLL